MTQQLIVELQAGRRVVARYGDFEIATDQSPASGGDGSAPEPFDLFLASLGTCAGAYVSGFCRQRGIPTDGIRLRQTWTRDADHRLATVDLVVELSPDFPEKYRAAVLRAVDQCAVKRTLAAPPVIETRVEPA